MSELGVDWWRLGDFPFSARNGCDRISSNNHQSSFMLAEEWLVTEGTHVVEMAQLAENDTSGEMKSLHDLIGKMGMDDELKGKETE